MDVRLIDVDDERSLEADQAISMIEGAFPRADRHSGAELRLELQEKRLRLLEPFDFHQLAALDPGGSVVGAATGVYLAALNAGFVIYLVVAESQRGRRLGGKLREALVERFAENARDAEAGPLSWILGEVRIDSPWLIRLVRTGRVIPFDLEYFHPDLPVDSDRDRYVLYREIISDDRREIPPDEVARILYAIYRRAYREAYPMAKENFRAMIDQLEGRSAIGPNQEVLGLARL